MTPSDSGADAGTSSGSGADAVLPSGDRPAGAADTVPGILTEVLGDPTVAGLPADTPLLAGGLALDSVTVVRLLAAVRERTGVDVADLDLDLDALTTIGTLTAFVAAHTPGAAPPYR